MISYLLRKLVTSLAASSFINKGLVVLAHLKCLLYKMCISNCHKQYLKVVIENNVI